MARYKVTKFGLIKLVPNNKSNQSSKCVVVQRAKHKNNVLYKCVIYKY